MILCKGINKNGSNCKNKIKNNNFCWRHDKNKNIDIIIKKHNIFHDVPNEIYIIIYDYLDFNDKINFSRTNRKSYFIFKSIIKDINIKILFSRDIKTLWIGPKIRQ